MKIAGLFLTLSLLSGCSSLDAFLDPNKAEFEETRTHLEREVEILLLKKRKAILEKQLDAVHESDFKIVPEQDF